MIKTIIFDLGEVILIQPPKVGREIIKRIFKNNSQFVLSIWETDLPKIQIGQMTSKDFLTKCKEKLNLEIPIDNLLLMWEQEYSKLAKVDEEMLALLKKLSSKYKVLILTDTIDAHYNHLLKTEIPKNIHGIIASYQEGVKKPGQEIFRRALLKFDLHPDETIFIDNLDTNIEGAKRAGIDAILFKNATQLKNDLADKGIKI